MRKKAFIHLAPLLALVLLATIPAIAQAETITLVSSSANSLCIRPKGFKPLKGNNSPNYARLTMSHNGAYPDTGTACEIQTPSHPAAMGPPGAPAGPFGGSIPGASWVSVEASGETSMKPQYFIYDETFTLCQNQAEAASISGTMFAGSVAGAFLNGQPIGNQPYSPPTAANFNGPPSGGWSFGPASSFKAGVNTLQFVVYSGSDETNLAGTGLDFSATLSHPPCEPQWFSNKELLKGEALIATSGELTFHASPAGYTIKCKKTDLETIGNPGEGRAGVDEIFEFTLSACSAKPVSCRKGTKLEVIAANLPWVSHLIDGPPIRDVIEGMVFEVRCSGTGIDLYAGTLSPTMGNSVDVFSAESGTLEALSGNHITVSGTDKMKGPPGDEKITAG